MFRYYKGYNKKTLSVIWDSINNGNIAILYVNYPFGADCPIIEIRKNTFKTKKEFDINMKFFILAEKKTFKLAREQFKIKNTGRFNSYFKIIKGE